MKRSSNVNLYWSIVWVILLIVWTALLVLGVERVFCVDSLKKAPSSGQISQIKIVSSSGIQKLLDPYKRFLSKDDTSFDENKFEVTQPLFGDELYRFYIAQICEQHYPDVDPYIALSVLEIESNYHPNVKSRSGAVGLMQVIPKYHAWRAEKHHLVDIWDPYTNIIIGIDLLNDLYNRYGDWSRALLGYNNSVKYVNAVLRRADALRGCGYFG